jgi:hypothetical protein
MPTKAEVKKAEEQAQAALKDGRFAAQESDDNSVAVSDEAYVGVSPEYRNAAYDTDKPKISEDTDQAELERAAKRAELDREAESADIGFRGYKPEHPHPSEARQPASERIDRQRRQEEAIDLEAQDRLGDSGSSEGEGSSEPPFGDDKK